MQFSKIFAVTLLVIGVAQSASAAPIYLVLGSQTDIMSFAVSIAYDASDELFTANGIAASWTSGGVTTGITDGVFELSAEIDRWGNASVGSLLITGSLSITAPPSTLLTGSLVAEGFGFDDTAFSEPDPFEFLFVTTGGDVGTMLGSHFGVILTSTTFLPVNPSGGGTVFEHDFSAPYAGIADAAITVPEPSSAVLVGLGLVMLAVVRRTGRDTSRV
jgi:hypothetical protein